MKTFLLLIFALALNSCAKERPDEPVYDFDGNRWSKATFLSSERWIAKSTVVNSAGYNSLVAVGIESSARVGRFEFTQDDLKFNDKVNLYPENRGKTADTIFAWKVDHSHYNHQVVNGKKTNRVTEDNTISWQAKQFFKVDWESVTIGSMTPATINCWQRSSSRVLDGSQEIDEQHINFVIEATFEFNTSPPGCVSQLIAMDPSKVFTADLIQTLHIKYSFAPLKDTKYEPYLYTGETDPLHQKYGFFNSTIISMDDYGQLKSSIVMDRWDPSKTHTYYFAEDFPEKYKSIFNDPETGIFARTNQLLERQKIDMRFEIKDNDGTKTFGDIRYSFVKINQEVSPVAPLGYGPHVANPFTGEILSANLVLWVGDLERLVKRIQERDDRIEGRSRDSSILARMGDFLDQPQSEWLSTADNIQKDSNRKVFDYLLPFYTYNNFSIFSMNQEAEMPLKLRSWEELTAQVDIEIPQPLQERLDLHDHIVSDLFNSMGKEMLSKNRTTVYPVQYALIDLDQKVSSGLDAEEMIRRILHRVSLHEFGHNLNLRHNFYGSVDKKNFKPEIDGHQQKSSSVMEYLSGRHQFHDHDDWESYDEAALTYAYTSGDTDLSKQDSKNFLYCTDEHVRINAMCNRFDSGTTPSEMALSMIESYEDSYWVNNFKYDRTFWNGSRGNSYVFDTMWNLKKILMMSQQTYFLDQASDRLSDVLSEAEILEGIVDIRNDLKQANSLAIAFYGSVVQQEISERPYSDTFDEFTGGLRQKGIWFDKFMASRFLLGDDVMIYNPNFGAAEASYLALLSDGTPGPDIKGVLERVSQQIFVAPGPNTNGFDSMGRLFYTVNAAGYLDRENNQAAVDRLKITCFTPSSLESSFGLADTFAFPFPDGSTQELNIGRINVTGTSATHHYFRSGTSEIALVKIGGNYFVASKEKNPYTFLLIGSGDISDVLTLHNAYYSITSGRIPECL